MNVSVNIVLVSVIATAVLQFYVAFFYRSFHRGMVILQAGLFMGISLAVMSFAAYSLMKKIPGFLEKKPRIHTIIFPPSVLICGILAEFFIFKLQGIHYFWLLAGVILSFFISLLLDAHEKIKFLITDSIQVLEKLYRQVILSLNKSLEAKEPYNKGHNERVAWYALKTARLMGMDDESCSRIARAALLHDLGKIGISEKILLKEGALDSEDWQSIRHHPGITERILKPVNGFSREIAIIRLHHEHMDGTGYGNVTGDDIPLESRIISVADAFDAMTTSRPYREAREPNDALSEIENLKGTRFDPTVTEAFGRFVRSEVPFEKPDYLKVRKEMALDELESVRDSEELDFMGSIRGAARQFTLLEKFYRMMGLKEKYILRRIFSALGTGILLGMFLGFSIYSTSGNPLMLISFVLQGVVGGLTVFITGVLVEGQVQKRARSDFWKGPLGRGIYFFPGGILAGIVALQVFLLFSPGSPRGYDIWNIMYIVLPGFYAFGVAFGIDFVQKLSSVLLINLKNLEKLYFQLIYSLAFALEAKDPYTRGHSERVALYSEFIAEKLGLKKEDKEELKLAALFHDVGKIGIRLSVLHKEARLDQGEFDHIKEHPSTGAEIIGSIGSFSGLSPYVRHHHEHYGGTGYPDGLKGEEIPQFSRIIAVADAFDALITERPYKKGMPLEQAVKIITEEGGTKFDPHIVSVFTGSIHELNFRQIREAEAYPDIEGLTRGEEAKP